MAPSRLQLESRACSISSSAVVAQVVLNTAQVEVRAALLPIHHSQLLPAHPLPSLLVQAESDLSQTYNQQQALTVQIPYSVQSPLAEAEAAAQDTMPQFQMVVRVAPQTVTAVAQVAVPM